MVPSILIRDVPESVKSWIDEERFALRKSQKEFLLHLLETVKSNGQMRLFSPASLARQRAFFGIPFSFIDLFAGIGGFRIGLERLGGRCVYSCEWDKYAQKTYKHWFGDTPAGDITSVSPSEIPDHDILAAGFPCQPFSIAGVSKKNALGMAHGFNDKAQGNLFFRIADIVKIKRPPVLFLENVKNLISHDKGRTWQVISDTLEHLNYIVYFKVIDAKHYVPQHRERIYIVCFDKHFFGNHIPFEFPSYGKSTDKKLSDILESNVDQRYILTRHLWDYLQRYAEKHKAKGNGFGYGLADLNGISRTISARYYKDGAEVLVSRGRDRRPRRLTPRECARLMGFPDSLEIVVSDTQAYRQFGNAVVPDVIEQIAKEIITTIAWHIINSGNGCLLKGSCLNKR